MSPYVVPPHPAKFSDPILYAIASLMPLQYATRILDPFAGTGRIFKLAELRSDLCPRISAIEIEPEWARYDERITVGNALSLPYADDSFDMVITSPSYGNRLADSYNRQDSSTRHSYRFDLGRPLDKDNSGVLQWGPSYRSFHERAWQEVKRVLVSNGIFILNIKDHVRKGEVQAVTDWHVECLRTLGFTPTDTVKVPVKGLRYGQNHAARVEHESVIKFVLA